MSEYLRILKKNKKQLENSSFILSGSRLILPSITKSDFKKIYKSAAKNNNNIK